MPDSRGADDGGRDAQARRAGRDPVESPDSPSGWADFVRADYEYPDDFKDLSRRERRKAMRSWRSDDHAKRTAWLRDRRQAEPGARLLLLLRCCCLPSSYWVLAVAYRSCSAGTIRMNRRSGC